MNKCSAKFNVKEDDLGKFAMQAVVDNKTSCGIICIDIDILTQDKCVRMLNGFLACISLRVLAYPDSRVQPTLIQ